VIDRRSHFDPAFRRNLTGRDLTGGGVMPWLRVVRFVWNIGQQHHNTFDDSARFIGHDQVDRRARP
jgi:hypothetical protein